MEEGIFLLVLLTCLVFTDGEGGRYQVRSVDFLIK